MASLEIGVCETTDDLNAPLVLDESPEEPHGRRRWRLTALFALALAWTLSVLFFLYIVDQFFAKPWTDWRTVTWYGQSLGRAIPIMFHWAAGSIILLLGPLQLLPSIRRRKLAVHRWNGRAYLMAVAVVGTAGALYVVTEGTAGGISMDVSFFLYGVLFLGCGCMTYVRARQRLVVQHHCWALRTFIMGVASMIYRVLISPLFVASLLPSSAFDSWSDDQQMLWLNIAAWLFYLPELGLMEIYIWRTTDRNKRY